MKKQLSLGVLLRAGTAAALAQQQNVEVLHFWTSGGEAAALDVLKDKLDKQGVKWNDMPVARRR